MAHGEGKLKNCSVIKSNQENFKRKRDGGESVFSEWISYRGRFYENTFHGPGELELPNGEKFIGEFVGGKVDGEGSLYQ